MKSQRSACVSQSAGALSPKDTARFASCWRPRLYADVAALSGTAPMCRAAHHRRQLVIHDVSPGYLMRKDLLWFDGILHKRSPWDKVSHQIDFLSHEFIRLRGPWDSVSHQTHSFARPMAQSVPPERSSL
jgi:hypothetical protein